MFKCISACLNKSTRNMLLRNVKDFSSRHIFKQYIKFHVFLRIVKIAFLQKGVYF